MNKKILFIAISLISLCSCGETSTTITPSNTITPPTTSVATTITTTSTIVKTYTITWKNYDGTVLEVDNDVPYGTMPSYDGKTPSKEANGNITYIFNGWDPNVVNATEDATYTAKFSEFKNDDSTPGLSPILNSNNEIEYGFYPQTNVKDQEIINELNKLSPSEINNWYYYNGEYYVKEIANIYNNESYKFDNGTSIVNGESYWFKCETIKWKMLKETDGSMLLLSSKLLDAKEFYDSFDQRVIDSKTTYANNYKESNIRNFLNNDFYNSAFKLNNEFIINTNVNNNASNTDSSDNKYICEDTQDKVFLLTYKDYLDANYGFETNVSVKSQTREAKTTDYARARGAFCNTSNYTGAYWTRSPSSEYDYCAWNVNSAGFMSEYVVLGDEYCIRPSVSINIK